MLDDQSYNYDAINFMNIFHEIIHPISYILMGREDKSLNHEYPHRSKPDDRSDNYEKLQQKVDDTLANYAEAKERLEWAPEHEKDQIEQKNARRKEAVDEFKDEMQDEIQE